MAVEQATHSRDAVIVAAVRTPIGRFQGALASLTAVELGAHLVSTLRERCELGTGDLDELIMGHVLDAGDGQNTARQVAVHGGFDETVPAMTINRVCGSSLSAVHLACQAIAAGEADIIMAGGMESMSRAAYVVPGVRAGLRMGDGQLTDTMIKDGLWDAFNDYHMGITAENLARRHGIDRQAQDTLAATSHERACAAMAAGRFDDEIVPVVVPQRRGEPLTIVRDEQPRADASAEGLARLKPAFSAEGSVTAGNASSVNDGAAALLIMSAETAARRGLPVLARVRGNAAVGVDPAYMGIGAAVAARRCIARAGMQVGDLSLVEANEAFAAQVLAVERDMGWESDRVNVNGGAIALGHPIGASGARVLVTLVHEMRRREATSGLATLCVGGGQGVATLVDRVAGLA